MTSGSVLPGSAKHASELSRGLAEVADLIALDDLEDARERAGAVLPFAAERRSAPSLSTREMTVVMLRDGFIDRYKGTPIWHPGALRLISDLLPDLIPYHPNGRLDACHELFWELSPSVDHLEPISRGGAHVENNCITASWASHTQKSNMDLQQLGWRLHPCGSWTEWDGYLGWFLVEMDKDPGRRRDDYLRQWERAARSVLADRNIDPRSLPSVHRPAPDGA
jgi:hypothetical protein